MAEKEYIERESALNALTERNLVVHMDSVNDGLVASCHRSAQRVIANIPAADVVEVRRGEWKETPTRWIYCSVCGSEPPEESNYKSNYCPNCGAKMDGGTDDAAD